MAYCTVNGLAATEGRLTLPRVGAWLAELRLEKDATPTGAATVVFGGLNFIGTVQRGGAWAGSGMVRIIGGAGAMHKTVIAKAYRGSTARLQISDALAAVGESVDATSDEAVMGFPTKAWVMFAEPAARAIGRVLDEIKGAVWRIRPSGKVWVGVDSFPSVTLSAQVLEQDTVNRRMTTEALPGLLPGVTWGGGKVSYVQHQLGSQLRSHIGFEL